MSESEAINEINSVMTELELNENAWLSSEFLESLWNIDFENLDLTPRFLQSLWRERVEKLVKSLKNVFSLEKIPELLIYFINFLWTLLWVDNLYGNLEGSKYIFWYKLSDSHLNKMWSKMRQKFPKTPLTASMIKKSCLGRSLLPVEYLLAFMQNDSWLWTVGKWARTRNPWNVWNDDAWNLKTFKTRQEWVDACADNLYDRIYKYFEKSAERKWKWFNAFPKPEELARWVSEWWTKFYGIYMSDKNWPARVASIAKKRNSDLLA